MKTKNDSLYEIIFIFVAAFLLLSLSTILTPSGSCTLGTCEVTVSTALFFWNTCLYILGIQYGILGFLKMKRYFEIPSIKD